MKEKKSACILKMRLRLSKTELQELSKKLNRIK